MDDVRGRMSHEGKSNLNIMYMSRQKKSRTLSKYSLVNHKSLYDDRNAVEILDIHETKKKHTLEMLPLELNEIVIDDETSDIFKPRSSKTLHFYEGYSVHHNDASLDKGFYPRNRLSKYYSVGCCNIDAYSGLLSSFSYKHKQRSKFTYVTGICITLNYTIDLTEVSVTSRFSIHDKDTEANYRSMASNKNEINYDKKQESFIKYENKNKQSVMIFTTRMFKNLPVNVCCTETLSRVDITTNIKKGNDLCSSNGKINKRVHEVACSNMLDVKILYLSLTDDPFNYIVKQKEEEISIRKESSSLIEIKKPLVYISKCIAETLSCSSEEKQKYSSNVCLIFEICFIVTAFILMNVIITIIKHCYCIRMEVDQICKSEFNESEICMKCTLVAFFNRYILRPNKKKHIGYWILRYKTIEHILICQLFVLGVKLGIIYPYATLKFFQKLVQILSNDSSENIYISIPRESLDPSQKNVVCEKQVENKKNKVIHKSRLIEIYTCKDKCSPEKNSKCDCPTKCDNEKSCPAKNNKDKACSEKCNDKCQDKCSQKESSCSCNKSQDCQSVCSSDKKSKKKKKGKKEKTPKKKKPKNNKKVSKKCSKESTGSKRSKGSKGSKGSKCCKDSDDVFVCRSSSESVKSKDSKKSKKKKSKTKASKKKKEKSKKPKKKKSDSSCCSSACSCDSTKSETGSTGSKRKQEDNKQVNCSVKVEDRCQQPSPTSSFTSRLLSKLKSTFSCAPAGGACQDKCITRISGKFRVTADYRTGKIDIDVDKKSRKQLLDILNTFSNDYDKKNQKKEKKKKKGKRKR